MPSAPLMTISNRAFCIAVCFNFIFASFLVVLRRMFRSEFLDIYNDVTRHVELHLRISEGSSVEIKIERGACSLGSAS